jgi:hypothetical protein
MTKIEIVRELFLNRTYKVCFIEHYSFKRGRKWIKGVSKREINTKDVVFKPDKKYVLVDGHRKFKCSVFDANTNELIINL